MLHSDTAMLHAEGTSLAVADYHDFYRKEFLIDVCTFEVPDICKQ